MNNKIWNYFEIAGKLTSAKKDNRGFLLGAVGIRNDGAMVSAINSISQQPNRLLHAEKKCLAKMDQGGVLYVARVRLIDGEFGTSKPCFSCEKAIRAKNIRRVFYTINSNEYGVLNF